MTCAISICPDAEEVEVTYLPEEGDPVPMPATAIRFCWRHARPLISGQGVRVSFRRIRAA